MADIKYILELDTKGAEKNLERLRGSIRQTNGAFEGFRGLLAGVAAAVSVREIAQLSDTVTNLRNKLIGVSPTLGDVENQFKAVAAIAITSRAPLEAVGDLYFRIARAGGELGISQRQAADITDTLAKSLSMTGVSAAEAAGPLLQIGQALQSGRFQGDELRSVLEGMPVVSQALADELGVTIGELRKLGSEGRITADVFVRAMEKARSAVNEAFIRTAPTISQAFENIRTASALAFNEFENNTNTGKSTAAAIELLGFTIFKLGRSIDEIITPLKTLFQIVGAAAAFSVAGRIIGGVFNLFRAGIGVINNIRQGFVNLQKSQIALSYALGGVSGFFDRLMIRFRAFKSVIEPAITVIGQLIAALLAFIGIKDIFKWFDELGQKGSEGQKQLEAYRQELLNFKNGLSDATSENRAAAAQQAELNKLITRGNEQLIKAAKAYSDVANEQARSLRDQIAAIGLTEEQIRLKDAQRNAESAYLAEAKRLQDELFRVKQSDKEEDKAQIPIILRLLGELDNRYRQNLQTNTELAKQLNQRLSIEKQLAEFDKMDDALKAQAKSINNSQAQLALETAKLRLSEREREAIDARYSIEQARISAIEPLQERLLEVKRSASESDKELIPIIEEQIAKVNQLYANAIPEQAKLLANKEKELQINKLINFTEETRRDTSEKVMNIQRETAKLTMTDIQKKYFDIANAAEDTARRAIQAEEKRRGIKLPIEEQRQYYEEAKAQTKELMQVTAQHELQSKSWSTGWIQAYNDYLDETKNAAKVAESLFKKATKGMEDAIVSFAKTGKFEFKNFVNLILEELLRIQIQKTFANLLGGTTQGGFIGSVGKILGFANGGIVPTNGPILVGERGPELISGAAGRTVTPNNQLGGTNITYNINAVDAMSFKQMIARDPQFIYAVTEQGKRSIPQTRR